jgi:hypothetical protein
MDHAVLKSYRGIGNIILQVGGVNTTRTIEGIPINNAILLNAHIDVLIALDEHTGTVEHDSHSYPIAAEVSLAEKQDSFLFNGAEGMSDQFNAR